jgi:hypothetical protein
MPRSRALAAALAVVVPAVLAGCDATADTTLSGPYSGRIDVEGVDGSVRIGTSLDESPAGALSGVGYLSYPGGPDYLFVTTGTRTGDSVHVDVRATEGPPFEIAFDAAVEDDGRTLDGVYGAAGTPRSDRTPLTLVRDGLD